MARTPKIALIDRDGTLIDVLRDAETGVITTAFHPSQVRLLPGVVEGLSALARAGWTLAIVTNQPGPAKGHFDARAVDRTNAALVDLLAQKGIPIARVEVCMHHPDGGPGGDPSLIGPCECRKPKPGLLNRAIAALGGEKQSTYMIGDSAADVHAARAAGVRAGLIFDPNRCELCPLRGGSGLVPDATGNRLDALVTAILQEERA
jgi:D-glycero-D-manno-heptose 1,7-bisphosphate phosphatase